MQCETSQEDPVEAYVAMYAEELADDPAAAAIAGALVRFAEGDYLDFVGPDEAARIATKTLREKGLLP